MYRQKRFQRARNRDACWRGALAARSPTTPRAGHVPRGRSCAAPRAPALQVIKLEPIVNIQAILGILLLDMRNSNRLHNKMDKGQEQVIIIAAPSPRAVATANAAAAARSARLDY